MRRLFCSILSIEFNFVCTKKFIYYPQTSFLFLVSFFFNPSCSCSVMLVSFLCLFLFYFLLFCFCFLLFCFVLFCFQWCFSCCFQFSFSFLLNKPNDFEPIWCFYSVLIQKSILWANVWNRKFYKNNKQFNFFLTRCRQCFRCKISQISRVCHKVFDFAKTSRTPSVGHINRVYSDFCSNFTSNGHFYGQTKKIFFSILLFMSPFTAHSFTIF